MSTGNITAYKHHSIFTVCNMMAEGRFPRAHRLGRGMVGVRIGDIRQWLEDPAGWRVQNA